MNTHNHPTRCCCSCTCEADRCPVCPLHGNPAGTADDPIRVPVADFVRQAMTPECSSCHQQAGRPHTDYCQAGSAPSLTDQIKADQHRQMLTPGYDGPEGTEWDRTTTSHHHTWGQDMHYPPPTIGAPHHTSLCRPDWGCPQRPTPHAEDTPPICRGCMHTDHPGRQCPICWHAPR